MWPAGLYLDHTALVHVEAGCKGYRDRLRLYILTIRSMLVSDGSFGMQ